jgi:glycosyl transferase family 2
MIQEAPERAGVSIICVYNDPDVRRDCLDRSVNLAADPGTVEYIPIDNTGGAFASAGAALNAGIRKARHQVMVLVHQDIYLHSIDRILEVATMLLADRQWGLFGAIGVPARGPHIGRVRDRVQLMGQSSPSPSEVVNLDEVLIMGRRDVLRQNPLSEDERLAWHAYGAELCVRLRSRGFKIGAVNLEITHNSLTTDEYKARLNVAHGHLAALYPDQLPISTTCGVVRDPSSWLTKVSGDGFLWRNTWMLESILAARASRRIGAPAVLSDICFVVDAFDLQGALEVINLDREHTFAESAGDEVRLHRRAREVYFTAVSDRESLLESVERSIAAGRAALITDVSLEDLPAIVRAAGRTGPRLVGVCGDSLWLLLRAPTQLPRKLQTARATPLFAGRS